MMLLQLIMFPGECQNILLCSGVGPARRLLIRLACRSAVDFWPYLYVSYFHGQPLGRRRNMQGPFNVYKHSVYLQKTAIAAAFLTRTGAF